MPARTRPFPEKKQPAVGFAAIDAVCDFTTKSRTTIYRWVKAGIFPPQVQLGPNSVGWRWEDLQAWEANPTEWSAAS